MATSTPRKAKRRAATCWSRRLRRLRRRHGRRRLCRRCRSTDCSARRPATAARPRADAAPDRIARPQFAIRFDANVTAACPGASSPSSRDHGASSARRRHGLLPHRPTVRARDRPGRAPTTSTPDRPAPISTRSSASASPTDAEARRNARNAGGLLRRSGASPRIRDSTTSTTITLSYTFYPARRRRQARRRRGEAGDETEAARPTGGPAQDDMADWRTPKHHDYHLVNPSPWPVGRRDRRPSSLAVGADHLDARHLSRRLPLGCSSSASSASLYTMLCGGGTSSRRPARAATTPGGVDCISATA